MNETYNALYTMLKQILSVDIPFTLQAKYQPIIDNVVNLLHKDIDDIADCMIKDNILKMEISAQETIDNC
jgi:hypothetical protein